MHVAGPQNDRVDIGLVMEMIEMLVGPADFDEKALALGVSTAALKRYQARGVPRYVAEALYDRLAYGLGPRKKADVYKEAV